MIRPALLLVLLALLVPAAAHADAKEEAQARMAKATELYNQGKPAEALNELTIAYTLDPRPEMLYAIGQMHVQLGNCQQAVLFYERFLTTNPDAVPAAAAAEAIETCKKSPDAVTPTPEPPPPPPPPDAQPPPPPPHDQPARWYTDKLAGGLLGGGVALGATGIVMYLLARSDLDEADEAIDYRTHAELVDSAHGKRIMAAVLGAVGLGLTGVAVRRYVLLRRADTQTVGIAPAPGGGLVTWSGRF